MAQNQESDSGSVHVPPTVTMAPTETPRALSVESMTNDEPDRGQSNGGDEVVEVLPTSGVAHSRAKSGSKVGKPPRATFTLARARQLVETANLHDFPEIYFAGVQLTYGKKGEAMKAIRSALASDPSMWPSVPQAETLESWLDKVVNERLKDKADDDQTGDGDDPPMGKLGVCTDTPLRVAVDEYIRRGKAHKRSLLKKRKEAEADEDMAARLQKEAMDGQKYTPLPVFPSVMHASCLI